MSDELKQRLAVILTAEQDSRADENTTSVSNLLELVVAAYKQGKRHGLIQALKLIEEQDVKEKANREASPQD